LERQGCAVSIQKALKKDGEHKNSRQDCTEIESTEKIYGEERFPPSEGVELHAPLYPTAAARKESKTNENHAGGKEQGI